MCNELSKFGIDWMNRFSNAEVVFKTLASHDRMSLLYAPVHVKRCLTLVALAKLSGPSGLAEATAHGCRTFLQARNDPQLNVFDENVRKLLAA